MKKLFAIVFALLMLNANALQTMRDNVLITGTLTATGGVVGYEPAIAAGASWQYWRGDKTWQALDSAVRPLFSGATPIVFNSGTGAISILDPLPVSNGGTGLASYAIGDLLYASGATTLAKLAGVATGNALISGGITTAPSWGKVGLTTHISGTLPVANGGTGATALTNLITLGTHTSGNYVASLVAGTNISVGAAAEGGTPTVAITGTIAQANGGTGVNTDFTAGSVIFDNGTGFAQDNANFFWDASNLGLGIGGAPGNAVYSFHAYRNSGNQIVVDSYGTAAQTFFQLRASRGTKTSPSDVVNGHYLGEILYSGYAGGAFRGVAGIDVMVNATGAVSSGNCPTEMHFYTTPEGSVSRTTRLTIRKDGTSEFDGFIRTDDGTNGSNGVATASGDAYVEDDLEIDNHAAIERLSVGSDTAPSNAGDLTVNNRFVPGAPATWQVTANSQTLTVTSSFHRMTSLASAYTDTRLGNGTYSGQILYITGDTTLNSVTFAAAAATSNIRVSAAGALMIDPYNTAVLIWDGTLSDWLEISRSAN